MAGYPTRAMDQMHVDDRDLSAFLIYAARERALDESLNNAARFAQGDEHKRSIEALRELNKRMLFRETRHPHR
jgi:hypothetical protein